MHHIQFLKIVVRDFALSSRHKAPQVKNTVSCVFFSLYYRGKCCYILEQVNSRSVKDSRIPVLITLPGPGSFRPPGRFPQTG